MTEWAQREKLKESRGKELACSQWYIFHPVRHYAQYVSVCVCVCCVFRVCRI
jgi:hypothetical protein